MDEVSQMNASDLPEPRRRSRWSAHASGRLKIAFAAVLLLAVAMAGCDKFDPSTDLDAIVRARAMEDVNQSLLNELKPDRMLMIADNAHGQWQPRQTVIDFLESWFQTVRQDSTFAEANRKLALVLELDSVYLARALEYSSTGEPEDFLDIGPICSGVFTTASMEFLWRLGDLQRRVEAYNADNGSDLQAELTLVPGEEFIDLDNWSFQKRSDFFLYRRDSLIAERLMRFVGNHPDHRVVIFYGAAHLQRGIVPKHTDEASAEGKFLAGYLDSLAAGGVCIVGQVTPDHWGQYRNLFAFRGSEYALKTADVRPEIRKILTGESSYDVVVVHPRTFKWGTPILRIPSMNIAALVIAAMPDISDPPNDFHKAYWPMILHYLNTVSGKAPRRLDLSNTDSLHVEYLFWKGWLDKHSSNIVPDVASLQLWRRLIDSLQNATNGVAGRLEAEVMSLLPYAPFLDRSNGLPSPPERAAQLRSYLAGDSTDIVVDNLLSILWAGNEAERRSARAALESMTDTTCSNPAQWSSWRRNQLTGAAPGQR